MITATTQFRLDISKWVEKAKGKAQAFVTELVQDLNEAIVEATPVKTGFLRASWYAQINSPANGTPGQGNVSTLNLTAAQIKIGDVYYMNNGARYAMRVEFGFVGTDSLGRKYNQHPRAFVRGTLDRAPAMADAAAARIAAT